MGLSVTPVAQTKLYGPDGIHNGNCFAACLASVLDLPLWMVPPFEDMFGRSRDDVIARADRWLRTLNGAALIRHEGHDLRALPEFYIANGPAPRGVRHSVVYQGGVMIHDPHPSGDGIKLVEWTWHVAPVVTAAA